MWTEAKEAISNSTPESAVYIGCDSVCFTKPGKKGEKDQNLVRYSTVVILHNSSRFGCRIFHHTETARNYGNMKQRLMAEVGYAIAAASEVVEVIGDRRLEVHLDLNNDVKHASNCAVKEAVGWVVGSGFVAKVKPDSWAATHVGDHIARQKLKIVA
jgi:predicted RNase H-related nuclease YkuK (DUF458 family)